MVRYVAVIVIAFAGMVAIGILARLDVLGDRSALIYITVSMALTVVAGIALYRGTRQDERRDRSGSDNDY